MPQGNRPTLKLVIPQSGDGERFNLGALWKTAKENVLSGRITTPGGETISFIAVPPDEPKQAAQPEQPAKPATRQRKAAGQQPSGAA